LIILLLLVVLVADLRRLLVTMVAQAVAVLAVS
jgi:hypothetical protein